MIDADPLDGPDDDVEPSAEVKQRRRPRERDTLRVSDGVLRELGARALERPRRVVNVRAEQRARARLRVEAVTLREKVLERAGPRRDDGRRGTVGAAEWKNRRAAQTARRLAASRLTNQTPGLSSTVT
jgi:hypothetical protein